MKQQCLSTSAQICIADNELLEQTCREEYDSFCERQLPGPLGAALLLVAAARGGA